MQIPEENYDGFLFYEEFVRDKNAEELQKVIQHLEKRIKCLKDEIKITWKYSSLERMKKKTLAKTYEYDYLERAKSALAELRSEEYVEGGELLPLLKILKSNKESKS